MRRGFPFFIVFALLALGGCAPKLVHDKWSDRPRGAKRVVSLSPSSTELIAGTGLNGMFVGRTAADNYPESVKSIPVVASVKPDYEKIKVMDPTWIIYDDQLYSPEDIQKLKTLGVPTFAITGDSVKSFVECVWRLANLVGGETTFADYVDRVNSSVARAEGDKISPQPKVAVIMPGGGGADMISGSKSFIADVVKISGGIPVGPDSNRFVTLSPEFLVANNPDFIVIPATTKDVATAAGEILNDPRFKSVSAVQKRHIVAIDQDIVLRRGDRVDKFIDSLHRALTTTVTP